MNKSNRNIIIGACIVAIVLIGVVIIINSTQPTVGDTVYEGTFVIIRQAINPGETSILMYDKETKLVYIKISKGYGAGLSPYYIVDKTGQQRIAIYPDDIKE